MIAKTLYGLEPVLYQELQELGATDLQTLTRAVQFTGDMAMLYKANYHLRSAIRVLVPIHHFRAGDERRLYQEIYKMDWSQYLDADGTLALDSAVQSSIFTHSLFISQKCKDAIVDQFRDRTGKRPNVDLERPDLKINIHIRETEVTVSLDSSGDSLHLRGYRESQTEAPLNEVLAAGMILLSGWDRQSNFVDFMCGSGTLLAEAGLMAARIAPGKFRDRFGFQTWKNFDRDLFATLKKEANTLEKEISGFTITGCDHSPKAVRSATENLMGAGFHNIINVETTDFTQFMPPAGKGTLMVNPPYGERLKLHDLLALYKTIGDVLKKRYAGYSAWILSSSDEGMKQIGLRPSRKIKLLNSSLECKFMRYDLYEGSKKAKYQQS